MTPGAGNAWRAAVAAALLLGGGCSGSGGSGAAPPAAGEQSEAPKAAGEVRKEFVILRELARQHEIQKEAGNEARVAAVERHLRERVEAASEEGATEAERVILRVARRLVDGL